MRPVAGAHATFSLNTTRGRAKNNPRVRIHTFYPRTAVHVYGSVKAAKSRRHVILEKSTHPQSPVTCPMCTDTAKYALDAYPDTASIPSVS